MNTNKLIPLLPDLAIFVTTVTLGQLAMDQYPVQVMNCHEPGIPGHPGRSYSSNDLN